MSKELTPKQYLLAEKKIIKANEHLLKMVAEKYGKQLADELEYEMFADAGSIGRAAIVSQPKGECRKSLVDGNVIKEAWSINEPGTDAETGEDYDVSFFFKLEEGKYFTYNSLL